MRSFAGVATLAIVMLVGGPLAAEDAGEALATVVAAPPSGRRSRGRARGCAAAPASAADHARAEHRPRRPARSRSSRTARPSTRGRSPPAAAASPRPRARSIRNGRRRMHYSRQYEYAPMPHAVFFHRGTAFHGTGAVGLLGQPASHGCVRLAPGNAAPALQAGAQAWLRLHQSRRARRVEEQGAGRRPPGIAGRACRPHGSTQPRERLPREPCLHASVPPHSGRLILLQIVRLVT